VENVHDGAFPAS